MKSISQNKEKQEQARDISPIPKEMKDEDRETI